MDEKFTQFTNFLGLTITAENYDTYQQLYRSFEKFCETHLGSTEFQFICWHRQYNPLKITTETVNDVEEQPQQRPLTNTPVLEYSPNHLPDALTKIQENGSCFTNFTLAATPVVPHSPIVETTEPTDILTELMQNNEFLEVLQESNSEDDTPITITQHQSRGKNIELLKASYFEEQNSKKPSKRSRSKPGSVRGSGRLTKDAAMLRIANYDDEEDAKTTTSMSLKELRLLTSTGDIHKKMPIYTRYQNDISCYAIKHYSSF
jgi:hypothetical protein